MRQDGAYQSLIDDCIENRRRVLREGDTVDVTSMTFLSARFYRRVKEITDSSVVGGFMKEKRL